jgi:hypothetical protein
MPSPEDLDHMRATIAKELPPEAVKQIIDYFEDPKEGTFPAHVYGYRAKAKELGEQIKLLHGSAEFQRLVPGEDVRNFDEMHANITLAYRHLEDAAMRLGKVIQAWDGGKSVYPR